MDREDWRIAIDSLNELAMRKKNRETEIFSLAFLDIITCGFGAIILLLLITRPIPVEIDAVKENVGLQSAIETLLATIARQKAELASLQQTKHEIAEPQNDASASLDASISEVSARLSELKIANQGLESVINSLKNMTIRATTEPEQRDPEVGGIPVDGEYVIFIVDTSGSMGEIWSRVIDVMYKVLDIHPKIKGFQVMNDNGIYLMDSTRRKWIPDTPSSRRNIKNLLRLWTSFSNSSPVEGLQTALKTYANHKDNISVYIFGDDFTGDSYDRVINTLKSLNTSTSTQQPIVRVHGIGFTSEYGSGRYATLLRYVTERNRGTFLGLP